MNARLWSQPSGLLIPEFHLISGSFGPVYDGDQALAQWFGYWTSLYALGEASFGPFLGRMRILHLLLPKWILDLLVR